MSHLGWRHRELRSQKTTRNSPFPWSLVGCLLVRFGRRQSTTPSFVSQRTASRLLIVALVALAVAGAAAAFTWPSQQLLWSSDGDRALYNAEIAAVSECGQEATLRDCVVVDVVLSEGPDAGQVFRMPEVAAGSVSLDVDSKIVVVMAADSGSPFRYAYEDHQRLSLLAALAIALGIGVVALGRVKGLTSLVGLAGSLGIVGIYTLPSLFEGNDPVVVTSVSAALISFVAIYFGRGLRPLTTVALLGTLGALAMTIGLGWLGIELAEFSGFGSQGVLGFGSLGSVNVSGLLLAGLVIGSIGALHDLTMSQVDAVLDLKNNDPGATRAHLFWSGMRPGGAHLAATVNTLIFAYVGASLPVLLLFVASDLSSQQTLNTELVASEIIRAAIGSLGLVMALPLTTTIAASVVAGNGPVAPVATPLPSADDRPPVRRSASPKKHAAAKQAETKEDPEPSLWERMRQGIDD